MRNMRESLAKPCKRAADAAIVLACVLLAVLLTASRAQGATKMSTSSLFLHTSYEEYSTTDSVSKKKIVIPSSHSNCFVDPAVTGDPKINDKKISYSASGSKTTCTSANNRIDADGAKSYPNTFTDEKYYVFDIGKSITAGTTNIVWIRNMALYDNEMELTANDQSRWALYDLKISFKPVVKSNCWINTSETRSCRFLFVGKSLTPKLAIYGMERCNVTFEYFEAGTSNPKTVSTYLTFKDLDMGQGIWMMKALEAPNGMQGPTYVAVAQDTNLGYTVNSNGSKTIRQLTSESHSGKIQDTVGIYYKASKLVLGMNSNYRDSKYTGAFGAFGSSKASMADRVPNKPYEWVETENNHSDGLFSTVFSQYDELFTYNIQHVVADGYEPGAYYSEYVLSSSLPGLADVAGSIRVYDGSSDVTSRFTIDVSSDNSLTVKAKSSALSDASFYNSIYTVKVPMRVRDAGSFNSYDELSEGLGTEVNRSEGSVRWSNKSHVSIKTKTGQQYSMIESNTVSCKAFFPIGIERLKAPGRTSQKSRIKVRGITTLPYRFAFGGSSILNRNRRIKGVLFYISDKDGRMIEGTETEGNLVSESEMDESAAEVIRTYASSIPVELSAGEYLTCMCTEYECLYNDRLTVLKSIITKPLIVEAYPSSGTDGIRYIDENVTLRESVWSEGERKNLLESILKNDA